ncbi:NtaA/DmoA family FMN-dependent monooxygenase [Streptomyces shenzhenensis]|uniref:NtaA/DmoA family FMN-dependent monooxygenase n=1 Tax=Streptomyces shenzhenensis TaxID=943815 RepID=UPI0033F6E601
MTGRLIHLNVNVSGTGYHQASWLDPAVDPAAFTDLAHYRRIAEAAERGTLDAILLPDIPVQQPGIRRAPTATLEPTLLLAALSRATHRIGLIPTASTSLNTPCHLARRILSLDHISGGRAGWNAVTTFQPEAARNFGLPGVAPHRERYRRAAEFIEVTRALWDGCGSGAFPADRTDDGGQAAALDHRGPFASLPGPLNLPRSPQGRPVTAQAGASEEGRELAARYGEVLYTSQFSLEDAQEYAHDIRTRARAHGRDPDEIRILPGLVPILGSTHAEARERFDALQNRLHPDSAPFLALANWLGFAPDELDLDTPLTEAQLEPPPDRVGPIGFYRSLAGFARRYRPTVRELLTRFLNGHRVVCGTPEQLADSIVEWWETGAADGFTLIPAVLPAHLEEFAEHVVPELRRRGVFRRSYTTDTLRGHLRLPTPARCHPHSSDTAPPAPDPRLTADILDRIDEIVPPGHVFHLRDTGAVPPAVTEPALRRRPLPAPSDTQEGAQPT